VLPDYFGGEFCSMFMRNASGGSCAPFHRFCPISERMVSVPGFAIEKKCL